MVLIRFIVRIARAYWELGKDDMTEEEKQIQQSLAP
jgi:hypothetical protein